MMRGVHSYPAFPFLSFSITPTVKREPSLPLRENYVTLTREVLIVFGPRIRTTAKEAAVEEEQKLEEQDEGGMQ